MPHAATRDTYLVLLLALVPSLLALAIGDRLYTGRAYYLIAPVVSLGLCAATFAPKPFLTGCALAFMSLYLFAVYPNLGSHSGNPWAGAVHGIGLVGGTALAVASGVVLRCRGKAQHQRRTQSLCIGLVMYLVGSYIAVQLLYYFKA